MRVAYVKTWQTADIAVAHKIWGANRNLVHTWETGEGLVILVGHDGVIVATVIGPSFDSDVMIWPNDVYEHRVPLRIERVVKGISGVQLNQAIRDALKASYGNVYGWILLTQSRLPGSVESLVQEKLGIQ